MIPTARREWFARWFARQARRRIRSTFGSVEVEGLEMLVGSAASGPVVVVANHSSWWDPLLALDLSVLHASLETYGVMDAANLRRLRFFALAGGYGFDGNSRTDGVRAIRYGAELLSSSGRALWVFPQGEERPASEPMRFRPGAARIAELARAFIVPVGFRYVFSDQERPRALVSFGSPLPRGMAWTDSVACQEVAVAQALARIDHHLRQPSRGFVKVFGASPGRRQRWMTSLLDRFAALWVRTPAVSSATQIPGAERKRLPAPSGTEAGPSES